MSNSFRDLIVWRRAKELTVATYKVTEKFPGHERFGLTSQMRRAAVSVPSNVAEGQGRATPGEFRIFLGHARGSLLELETQIEIATDLGFLAKDDSAALLERCREVSYLLNRLISSLTVKRGS